MFATEKLGKKRFVYKTEAANVKRNVSCVYWSCRHVKLIIDQTVLLFERSQLSFKLAEPFLFNLQSRDRRRQSCSDLKNDDVGEAAIMGCGEYGGEGCGLVGAALPLAGGGHRDASTRKPLIKAINMAAAALARWTMTLLCRRQQIQRRSWSTINGICCCCCCFFHVAKNRLSALFVYCRSHY